MIDKAGLIYEFLDDFEQMYKKLLINLKVSEVHIDYLINDNYNSYKDRCSNISNELNELIQEEVKE